MSKNSTFKPVLTNAEINEMVFTPVKGDGKLLAFAFVAQVVLLALPVFWVGVWSYAALALDPIVLKIIVTVFAALALIGALRMLVNLLRSVTHLATCLFKKHALAH